MKLQVIVLMIMAMSAVAATEGMYIELSPQGTAFVEVTEGDKLKISSGDQDLKLVIGDLRETMLVLEGEERLIVEKGVKVELFDIPSGDVLVSLVGMQKNPYSGVGSATLLFEATIETPPQQPSTPSRVGYDVVATLSSGDQEEYVIRGDVYAIEAFVDGDDVAFTVNGEFTYSLDLGYQYDFADGSIIVPLSFVGDAVVCGAEPCALQDIQFGFIAPQESRPSVPADQQTSVFVGESFAVEIGESVPVNPPRASSSLVMTLVETHPNEKLAVVDFGTGEVRVAGRYRLASAIELVIESMNEDVVKFHFETRGYNHGQYTQNLDLKGTQNLHVLDMRGSNGDVKVSVVNNGDDVIPRGEIPYFVSHDGQGEEKRFLQVENWEPGEVKGFYLEDVYDEKKYPYLTITGLTFVVNPTGLLVPYSDTGRDYEARIDDNAFYYLFYSQPMNVETREGERVVSLSKDQRGPVVALVTMEEALVVQYKDAEHRRAVPAKLMDYDVREEFAAIGNPQVYTKLHTGESVVAFDLEFDDVVVQMTLVELNEGNAVVAFEVVERTTTTTTYTPTDLEALKLELAKLREELQETREDLKETQEDLEETRSLLRKLWDAVAGWFK